MANISLSAFAGGKPLQPISAEDFAGGQPLTQVPPTPVAPVAKPGLFSRISTDLSKRGSNLYDTETSNAPAIAKGLDVVGQGAGFANDILGEGIKSVASTVGNSKLLTDSSGATASDRIGEGAKEIMNSPEGQLGVHALQGGADVWNAFKKVHPDTARALGDIFNIASLIPGAKGAEVAADAGIQAAKGTAETVGKAATATAAKTAQVVDTTKTVANGIKATAEIAAGAAARTPGRIAANVGEKVATSNAIKELPTKIAQDAAHSGVDINDVRDLYNLPAEQKNPVRQLAGYVKQYAEGNKAVHPIEIVGRPIVQRLKQLKSAQGKVGQALGAAADELGSESVGPYQTVPALMKRLNAVPGLSGLKVGDKGALDFTDTVLQSAATKSDRQAIQQIFSTAAKAGTGKQKHLLRQELFEVLDGKKKSLANITGTQERSYQAVRQGLSDVLEKASPKYKALNTQYATISRPLQEMQKFMKASTGTDEDILNMKAGLLARRLTSNAGSGPELKRVLRTLDAATAVKGKATLSTEKLQDAYNILQKYYPEIVNKTSLQGEVRSGIEGAKGITDAVMKVVGGFAGNTDTVRRQAFEKALEEALK